MVREVVIVSLWAFIFCSGGSFTWAKLMVHSSTPSYHPLSPKIYMNENILRNEVFSLSQLKTPSKWTDPVAWRTVLLEQVPKFFIIIFWWKTPSVSWKRNKCNEICCECRLEAAIMNSLVMSTQQVSEKPWCNSSFQAGRRCVVNGSSDWARNSITSSLCLNTI